MVARFAERRKIMNRHAIRLWIPLVGLVAIVAVGCSGGATTGGAPVDGEAAPPEPASGERQDATYPGNEEQQAAPV